MEEEAPGPTFHPELVGRDGEMNELRAIWSGVKNGSGSTVFVSGEAGVGKTRLIQEFMDSTDAKFIKGWCLADNLEPLMPFREALRDSDLYHLASEEPPPRVISAYLIDQNGVLIAKAERRETELDPDIFASMFTAVENFVGDSLAMMGEKAQSKLQAIGYGEYDLLIQTMGKLSLVAVIEGTKNEFLIKDMRKTLMDIGGQMDFWEGDAKTAKQVEPKVRWFIESRKYDGTHLVEDPKIKQENLFDNVLLGLRRLSSRTPVIVFLDDLQWADPTSLKLLHYLSRNMRENRVMLLGTYRPEDVISDKYDKGGHPLKTTMQYMSREDLYREINLDRLDPRAVSDFIQNTLGEVELEQGFMKKVYDESEGNPFFLLEILRLFVDDGHLKKEDGTWVTHTSIEDVHIPSKVYDVITRRLNRLNSEQRDILECASVVGEEFESTVVGRVTGMNRMKLLKDFNKIENEHNLIHYNKKKYMFDHSKIREVLYEGINKELREEYHRMIAESYEELYEVEEVVENIADHFLKARDERAFDYLLDAADKAKNSYANEEAVEFYTKALSITDEDEKLKRIHKGLGYVYLIIGRYEESLENYRSALEITEDPRERGELHEWTAKVLEEQGKYGESLRIAEEGLSIVQEDCIERCRLLKSKGWALLRQSQYDDSIEVFKEEKQLAEKLGDPELKAQALHDVGSVYLRKGEYDLAEMNLREAIGSREKLGDLIGLGVSLNNIGVVYHEKGEFDRSLEFYEKSLSIREQIGYKQGIAMTLNNIGNYYRYKGMLEEGLDYYQRSLDMKEVIGDKRGIAMTLNNMGKIYEEKGDFEKALDNYRRSLEIRKEINDKGGVAECLCKISEMMIEKGELKAAEEYTDNAAEIAVEIGSKKHRGMCHRVLGMVYREQGSYEESRVELEGAVKAFSDLGEKAKLARVYYEFGLLWKKRGDEEKAKKQLDLALNLFDEMEMNIWSERTREVIESL
ncbi:MAG: tetratricopeptide repeat protein [Thermoplasmata archaeon]